MQATVKGLSATSERWLLNCNSVFSLSKLLYRVMQSRFEQVAVVQVPPEPRQLPTVVKLVDINESQIRKVRNSVIHPPDHLAPPLSPFFRNLTDEAVAGVENFLFFVGYGRSGHSIVASILDAHPNVIVAHEYYLFDKLANLYWNRQLQIKRRLFDELYWSSYDSALRGWRANLNTTKGYNLNLKGTWQGQFGRLKVIGDKTAGSTAMLYHRSPLVFKRTLTTLEKITGIPHSVLHVVRNPYDMVATVALYQASEDPGNFKVNASVANKFRDYSYMKMAADIVLTKAAAVGNMVEDCKLHLLEVHLEDLISDPSTVIYRMCHFLDVPCDPAYMRVCQSKVFQRPSRSRDLVMWPEPVKRRIREAISNFSFFHRYLFE